MKRLAFASLALALISCGPAAEAPDPDQWVAVNVEAAPVDLGVAQIGRLRSRGGVELSSESLMFGGFSGLEVLDDGRIVAVTDNADWMEARLVLDESGTLVGLANVRMAYMRDERGVPFESKNAGDAEGLTQMPDGRFAVSFEQTQTIRIYDLNRDGPFGAAQRGPRLEGARRLHRNEGLESVAADESGALIVGAEGGGAPSPIWRAPLGAGAPVDSIANYQPAPGYSLTGLDRLPDGGFIALERFYAPVIGARARLVWLPALVEGDWRGEELAELAPPMLLDNFESVAAVRMPNGATRLYIISDNNFAARQRTLLYAFDVVQSAGAP